MYYPTVTERETRLEPLVRDTFIDSLAAVAPEPAPGPAPARRRRPPARRRRHGERLQPRLRAQLT